MAILETSKGIMKAEAWPIGKMVSADPSGFNWRIMNEHVDLVIDSLRNYGGWYFRLLRKGAVTINNYPDKVHIVAEDGDAFTETILTSTGRDAFINILRSVQARENIEYRSK